MRKTLQRAAANPRCGLAHVSTVRGQDDKPDQRQRGERDAADEHRGQPAPGGLGAQVREFSLTALSACSERRLQSRLQVLQRGFSLGAQSCILGGAAALGLLDDALLFLDLPAKIRQLRGRRAAAPGRGSRHASVGRGLERDVQPLQLPGEFRDERSPVDAGGRVDGRTADDDGRYGGVDSDHAATRVNEWTAAVAATDFRAVLENLQLPRIVPGTAEYAAADVALVQRGIAGFGCCDPVSRPPGTRPQ